MSRPDRPVRLGLGENAAQFSLLVALNAFVGAMVGLERSALPLVAERDFGVKSAVAVLSFIVAFGVAKAVTNLAAGALAEHVGRRRLLILGWAFALPVPLLIGVAHAWWVIVAANALLGLNQGLAWSMTVLMKIDLVGPRRRGLALGLNEAAGYGGLALAAALAGWLAAAVTPRAVLVGGGLTIALVALAISMLFVRDTAAHAALENLRHRSTAAAPSLPAAFALATWQSRPLRACSQAGLVNNLNDGLAWGLIPLFLAAHGATVAEVGLVAGLYPAVWGVGQLMTGAWSDSVGRRPLIVAGMLLQAAALSVLAASSGVVAIAALAAYCWEPAPPWCTRRSWLPSAMWSHPWPGPPRLACIASGAIWATSPEHCWPVRSPMPSATLPPSRRWPRSPPPPDCGRGGTSPTYLPARRRLTKATAVQGWRASRRDRAKDEPRYGR